MTSSAQIICSGKQNTGKPVFSACLWRRDVILRGNAVQAVGHSLSILFQLISTEAFPIFSSKSLSSYLLKPQVRHSPNSCKQLTLQQKNYCKTSRANNLERVGSPANSKNSFSRERQLLKFCKMSTTRSQGDKTWLWSTKSSFLLSALCTCIVSTLPTDRAGSC